MAESRAVLDVTNSAIIPTSRLRQTQGNVFRLPVYYKFMIFLLKFEIVSMIQMIWILNCGRPPYFLYMKILCLVRLLFNRLLTACYVGWWMIKLKSSCWMNAMKPEHPFDNYCIEMSCWYGPPYSVRCPKSSIAVIRVNKLCLLTLPQFRLWSLIVEYLWC